MKLILENWKRFIKENLSSQEALSKLKDISKKNNWMGNALLITHDNISKQLDEVFGQGNYDLTIEDGKVTVMLYDYEGVFSKNSPYEAFWIPGTDWTQN